MRQKTILLSILSILLISKPGFGQVIINEYSCSNISTVADQFGEYEDWIELYNTTGSPVDLTGWYLSDKQSNPTKWQIPSGTVPANGYLVVKCSGRDLVQAGELHPNFNLKQIQNEWIILSNSFANLIDSYQITNLTKSNHSVGRETNGAINWKLFTTPTPGAANAGAQDFYEPTPTMDLTPGFYSGAQTVTISCTDPGATIHYTLDGSVPTAGSPTYTAPLNIAGTTVVRAVAFGTNQPSFTCTNSYFINVTHDICVVSVCSAGVYDLIANGNSGIEPQGSFELFEQDGTFVDEGEGNFNKHGNDSWAYPQRGFDFVMRDQFGYNDDIDHQIFPEKGRSNFQRLILKPGASDNYPFETGGAHIRDALVHTLSIRSDLLLDERTWRPCVVYLNGQYWGIYEIREKADDHDFTDHYYNQDKFHLKYLKTWGGTWEEYGSPNALTDWNALRNFIMTNNMGPGPDFDYVTSQLKWKSLADYFMINSYTVNKDWLNWNTAWWRGTDPNGSKLKWRYTLWDLDATFGHYVNYTGIPDPTANADPCNAENLPNPGGQGHTDILSKLIAENPEVEQYYVTRYVDLVNTYFSCDYINFLLDSMLMEISPEMPNHVAKWGGSVAGWNANVQALKDFIDLRCQALEQGLMDCYGLTGPYDVVFDVSPVNSGTIEVNSIFAPTYPWATQYYGGIETLTKAHPNPGFIFDHWEYTVGPMNQAITEDTNGININNNENITAFFIADIPDDDGDGVPNTQEATDGTDPNDPCDYLVASVSITITSGSDCDGDGITDADEIAGGSDPFNFCDPNDSDPSCQIDTDNDGVTDINETNSGTDPNDPCSYNPAFVTLPSNIDPSKDCDGDGFSDLDEITNGTDPFDACDPEANGIECVNGVFVPTGFSPNGDNNNDIFSIIVGKDVKAFTFHLYDRWGNKMFVTSEKGFTWDGTYKGDLCNTGVYAYMLEIVYFDGSGELRSGNITLIR